MVESDIWTTRWHVKMHSFQMTNMLFLMRSMCVSLGFSESQDNGRQQEKHESFSLEQMRTFAGVYYLVTMYDSRMHLLLCPWCYC